MKTFESIMIAIIAATSLLLVMLAITSDSPIDLLMPIYLELGCILYVLKGKV